MKLRERRNNKTVNDINKVNTNTINENEDEHESEEDVFEQDYKEIKKYKKKSSTLKSRKSSIKSKEIKTKIKKLNEQKSEYFQENKIKIKNENENENYSNDQIKLKKQTNVKKDNRKEDKAENIENIKNELNECKNMESKIDLMLKMESISTKLTQPITNLNNSKNHISEMSDNSNDSETESEFEEVKMETDLNNIKAEITKGATQVLINDKKQKKQVDIKAKMERMLKQIQKKFSITCLKTHLSCWLAHGFYLNKYCLTPIVYAISLSIDQFNILIDKFQLINFNKDILIDYLTKFNHLMSIKNKDKNFFETNFLITSKNLCQSMTNLNCANYLQYLLILIVCLRNLNIKTRLCVCFDVNVKEVKEETSKKKNKKNNSRKLSESESEISDDEKIDLKIDLKKTKNSIKRKSKKLSQNESELDDEDNNDEKFQNKKLKLDKSKRVKKSNKQILSNDEDESLEEEEEDEEEIKKKNYKNYWIEVYLEEEKYWCPVEPFNLKIDSTTYLEQRFNKQILYVCAFDNDNRVKDVTKRYASEWETTTRLLRISNLEEKKLWWEKTLIKFQPFDIHLDIEEEKELLNKLKQKPLPLNVSDFKNHPLYILPRHLLKFQSIYPSNALPISHFRNEPVYSRDNLVTLHSRQTWLKYARMVKAFEKPAKIVKGRLKRSEYKAGCRDNPDLDLYGYWQTKAYEPLYAQNGIVPRNEFGNVELFQACMLPHGCVHLKNMPNLIKVCRKLKIDCAAAVVGFDAHGGFSHAVYDGWIVCEEYKDIVIDAYKQEEIEINRKLIEKNQERIINNWKRLIKSLLIREKLKLKYGHNNHYNPNNPNNHKKNASNIMINKINEKSTKKLINSDQLLIDDDLIQDKKIDTNKVGAKLNHLNNINNDDNNNNNNESIEFNANNDNKCIILTKTKTKTNKKNVVKQKRKNTRNKINKSDYDNDDNDDNNDDDNDENKTDADYEINSFKSSNRVFRSRRQTTNRVYYNEQIDDDYNNRKVDSNLLIKQNEPEKDDLNLSEDESDDY